MIIQGMSQIREAYFISFRGEINQKNMEERENEMKQKKTGISAEKQEQWILQGKYVILAVLVGICVGIVDTIFGRGLLTISDFREQYYRYLLPILPVAGLAIVWMYQRFSSLSLKGMTLVFEVGQKKREEIPLALDTTWNGPGIVYFLVSEKGMERMQLPVQTFVLEMDVNRSMEPMIRESVEKSVDSYNMQFVTGSSHGDYISDARTLMLVSKSELLSAARSYIASSRIIMYGLCLVLLFMGSMNYFHVIVTGYTVRKKEFSMMQSIGMTTRQLKNMTRMEGIFYGLIVGVLVLTVGSGVLGVVAVVMKSRVGYFRFVYPWRELIGVLLILGGLCVAIPEGVFRRMRKNREIERGF